MPNVDYAGPAKQSTWRRVAAASWAAPHDPTIYYGMLDVDARPMEACIARLRAEGIRITVTHVVAWAVARALTLHPDLNVMILGRRAWRRERVDVFVQVVMPGEGGGSAELTGVRIGVDTAFAPLYPMGGPPILIAVGRSIVRPWVDEETGEIVARPILRLAGTFDHRAMDGWHLAMLARDLVAIMERGLEEDVAREQTAASESLAP